MFGKIQKFEIISIDQFGLKFDIEIPNHGLPKKGPNINLSRISTTVNEILSSSCHRVQRTTRLQKQEGSVS